MWIRRPSDLFAVAAVASALAISVPSRAQQDDALHEWRDRFKAGMDRYRAGAVAEAIAFWEPVYREMGAAKGYRLAYNLGVAYQEFGDATHAAERFESFLAEVDVRRARKETLEPIVAKEETEAKARMATLTATKGRIRVVAGARVIAAQIDAGEPRVSGFVAYVTPGAHKITFAPGTSDATTQDVVVKPGELLEVAAPPPPAEIKPTNTPPSQPSKDGARGSLPITPPLSSAPATIVHEIDHPFHVAAIFVSGTITAVSVALPIVTYAHAASLRRTYATSTNPGEHTNIENDYGSAQATANLSLAVPIVLALTTATLATWYLVGTRERDVVVPIVAPTPNGALAGVGGRF
jgi:hypothetical protein